MKPIFASLFLAALLLPAVAVGQSTTLVGTVVDRAGAVISDAAVSATSLDSGISRTTRTSNDGEFTLVLPPGLYRVEVESTGFRRMSLQNVEVGPNVAEITATLDPGPLTEVVELGGQTSVIDNLPEISRAYGTRPLHSLPVFDRNYQELSGLMTGVTPPTTDFDLTMDPQQSRQFHTNGLPSYTNDNLTEGLTVREPYTGTLSARVIPNEHVEQLSVATSNYSAKSGFASGAITNIISRPGGNDVHGSLFGFHSGDFFRAKQPLAVEGGPEPSLSHWQTGATLGGALIPDNMFFMGSYQATLREGSYLQRGSVPTAAMRMGNLSTLNADIYDPFSGSPQGANRNLFPGSVIPASRQINPVSRSLLSALPLPNQPGLTNNLVAAVPFENNSHVADGKLDHRFSDAVSGFLKYGYSHFNTMQGSLFGTALGGATNAGLRNHQASGSIVTSVGTWVGEFRFGYNRYRNALRPQAPGGLEDTLQGLGFSDSIPTFNVAGLGTLGPAANVPARMVDNTYEGGANFQWFSGMNQIHLGAEYRRLESDGWNNNILGPNGTFFFGPGQTSSMGTSNAGQNIFANSLASLLLGRPAAAGRSVFTDTPSYRQDVWSGYLSDTIRWTQNFTLELGARYDVFAPVTTRSTAGAMIFDPDSGTVDFTDLDDVDAMGNVGYDMNNVSPRVGFAYSPIDTMAIRGGYSITYYRQPFQLSGINPAMRGVQLGTTAGAFNSTPFVVPDLPQATDPTNGLTAPNVPLAVRTSSESPYYHSYYLMWQHEHSRGLLFDVSYVGNLGRTLPYIQQLNVSQPNGGVAGLPFGSARTAGVSEYGSGLTSNYNALQVNLTKRLSRGVSFSAAYTYGKALDYGTALLNNFNRAATYGPADWDRTQMLTVSHVFEIPFGNGTDVWNSGLLGNILAGWQLNGIFRWVTGAPYTILADPLASGTAGGGAVPAFVPAGSASINGQASFDPSAFRTPQSGTLGNLGRNSVRGPETGIYNLSLFKSFMAGERTRIELRGEMYNVTNSVAYSNPIANLSSPGFGSAAIASPGFGFNGIGSRQFLVGTRILF